jgi:peptide/nickel transport system substrate-binding protein
MALARIVAAAATLACIVGTAHAQKAGGTLRVYHRDNPPTASLHEESTISTVMPFMAVFNNLFVYNQQAKRNSTDDLTPELATEWAWNADRTMLTLKLRQDVKWHDGKPFTSADVKCTFDWVAGKQESGWRKNPRKGTFDNLKEVATNGDFEVSFQLGRPQPSFVAFLANAFAPVYPCHVSGRDQRSSPVGTGPFKVAEFKPNERIRLVRNPDYWRPGRPYLDSIDWTIIPNRSTRVLAFVNGDFDLTFTQDVTAALRRDIQSQAPKIVCELNPSGNQGQLLVNRNVAPFDNAKVRRAATLALDRKAFVDIISQGNDRIGGIMLPPPEGAWGLAPEQLVGLPGFGDDIEKNREEGRRIMKDLGYGPDKTLKVKVSTRNIPLYRDPAVILIDQLRQVYIEGELEPIESAVFLSRFQRHDFVASMNVNGFSIDDPDVMYYERFACNAELNFGGYCNKEMEKRFDEQSMAVDQEVRKKLVNAIDLDLQKDDAVQVLFHTRANTCWQPQVKGINIASNSQYNHWRFEDAWLDK